MAEKKSKHHEHHDHSDHHSDEEEKEETLATAGVIDKYQEAGKIANSKYSIWYKIILFSLRCFGKNYR